MAVFGTATGGSSSGTDEPSIRGESCFSSSSSPPPSAGSAPPPPLRPGLLLSFCCCCKSLARVRGVNSCDGARADAWLLTAVAELTAADAEEDLVGAAPAEADAAAEEETAVAAAGEGGRADLEFCRACWPAATTDAEAEEDEAGDVRPAAAAAAPDGDLPGAGDLVPAETSFVEDDGDGEEAEADAEEEEDGEA